jgi:hypothetical protein
MHVNSNAWRDKILSSLHDSWRGSDSIGSVVCCYAEALRVRT